MRNGPYAAGIIASAMLISMACSSADDETSTNVTQLPQDFPRELIPESYSSMHYMDMKHINGTETVAFESTEAVEDSIQHYVELLGDPTVSVEGDDGEWNANWHSTPWPPWIVGVLGNEGETFVSVSKLPE